MKLQLGSRCPALVVLVAISSLAPRGAASETRELRGKVVDARTGEPLASRVYVHGADGRWHFARTAAPQGSAVRYERRNRVNPDAVEIHTTLSAHPFVADLLPGSYAVIVERGKEYFPERREVTVGDEPVGDEPVVDEPVELEVRLRRWIDMAGRGWYSGETHVHRTLEELKNVAIAEDLNVSFPLSFWVTKAFAAPAAGDRNVDGEVPEGLVVLDATHVVWPRNTEYEIFTVGDKGHTLGALFLLGHRSIFEEGVPPWGPVARKAAAEGALLDMDKLDWPFAFSLPHATGATLYELANNHVWRTEFGFTDWVSEAPPFLQPPFGGKRGGEREWVGYTLGMYYVLLDCGFRLSPTAGTASGVHPVPLGFSRVYVRLPDGFGYAEWLAGLAKGRSFVTTGPMLFATLDGRDPGETFRLADRPAKLRLEGSVVSEEPLGFIEVVRNGLPWRTYIPGNRRTDAGAYESAFAEDLDFAESAWIAVRAWEDRARGRFRFAHSAPWWVEVPGRPLRPREEEREFIVRRLREELARSRGIVPAAGLAEYERALEAYEGIETRDDAADVERGARPPQGDDDLRSWLESMVWYHRYTSREIRAATGLSLEEIEAALRRFGISDATRPARAKDAPILVLPYPGGRHPRTGFLDGAIDPARETKISVFPPWADGTRKDGPAADAGRIRDSGRPRDAGRPPVAGRPRDAGRPGDAGRPPDAVDAGDAGYFVVDVPEAIFSNLGLLYLAHTHVPTIWEGRGEKLPRLEWTRRDDGSLDFARTLPNGVAFGARVVPERDAVRMELWLRNGTDATLTGLRVQNCVMFKAARGFSAQTNRNKVLAAPYAAARSEDGCRWIITAWDACDRTWANPPVPCLHSDPRFPDCPPGETRRLKGWISFHEGDDLDAEIRRIEATGWRRDGSP